jgi:hypothetical protein
MPNFFILARYTPMSLDKAIASGKEHRTPYRRSKSIDRSCRNHGSCDYCQSNRTHANKRRELSAQEELNEYSMTEYYMIDGLSMTYEEMINYYSHYGV